MKRCRHVFIGAASALAIAALPLDLESMSLGSFEPASALAKGGNGGGNGHGGGNGNGGGKSGGNGHSGAHGKSADAGGRAKSGGGVGIGSGRLKSMFGQETRVAKGKKTGDTRIAKATGAKNTKKSVRAVEVVGLPEFAPVPIEKPKEKKLNARLAGLNSLKRNYHAYLNSQAPRMASIRAFVLASANLDIANEKLSAAEDAFAAAVEDADLQAFADVPTYSDPTLEGLQDRLDALKAENDPALQPEIDAIEAVLDSEEAAALADAQEEADLAAVGTDDEALRQALLDGANKNRVAQYGEENYVNDDVMDWAKDVLGVGDDFGKIDEVRETLEIDQQ